MGGNTIPIPGGRRPTGEGGIDPISKDEDGIIQYVRARLMVMTLLLTRLEKAKNINSKFPLVCSMKKFQKNSLEDPF